VPSSSRFEQNVISQTTNNVSTAVVVTSDLNLLIAFPLDKRIFACVNRLIALIG